MDYQGRHVWTMDKEQMNGNPGGNNVGAKSGTP
jgi:hypothetical protein